MVRIPYVTPQVNVHFLYRTGAPLHHCAYMFTLAACHGDVVRTKSFRFRFRVFCLFCFPGFVLLFKFFFLLLPSTRHKCHSVGPEDTGQGDYSAGAPSGEIIARLAKILTLCKAYDIVVLLVKQICLRGLCVDAKCSRGR